MDYFSKFLKSNNQTTPKPAQDYAAGFHTSWTLVKNTLMYPDERQLTRGIQHTDVPACLKSIVDSLVWESTRTEEGDTGPCLEYLLKNDVLGSLVRLSESDRPFGIQAEVLRSVQNMVILLDEQFLVHSVVHRAVLRLLRTCVGDNIQEQLDGRSKVMGAAGTSTRTSPSEYEEDLVNLLCILCSRIRTYRELLMIFFYDKHRTQPEPLSPLSEDDEDEDERLDDNDSYHRASSPTPSEETITPAPIMPAIKKPEYEFILFNYLLRFFHREGKIGEFARAGLLFLMDVAMSPGSHIHRLAGDDDVSSSSSLTRVPQGSDPIVDAALALAEYILDGDFSEVLGAGLGAVYSLLPSKLKIRHKASDTAVQSNGMVIGGTGPETMEEKLAEESAQDKAWALGTASSSNFEFKARLEHFLRLIEFLEDILRRNVFEARTENDIDPTSLVGSAIVQSILDAVRRIFLENVLYPSILECSDVDGSSVAVISYIDIMIRSMQDGQLADMFVEFLTSEDDTEATRPHPRRHSTLSLISGPSVSKLDTEKKLKRRKSSAMMLLEMEAPDSAKQSEYFTSIGRFTLKDLLLTNLRSNSQPSITAALQLMQSLLIYRCATTVERLIITVAEAPPTSVQNKHRHKVSSVSDDDDETFLYPGAEEQDQPTGSSAPPAMAYYTQESEMDMYFELIARINPSHSEDAFSTGYDHYLRGAVVSIQCHSCYSREDDSPPDFHFTHRLDPNDPIISLILQSLRKFFMNPPEENITLSGVIANLSFCPSRSLKGWLMFGEKGIASSNNTSDTTWKPKEGGEDQSMDFGNDERLAFQQKSSLPVNSNSDARPVLYTILHGLVAQLDVYRKAIPDFDKFLSERRLGLLFSENLTDALNLPIEPSDDAGHTQPVGTPVRPLESSAQKAKPTKQKSSSWASLLTPRKMRTSSKTTPNTPSEDGTTAPGEKSVSASPFGTHYRETRAVAVDPFVVPAPSTGLWASPKQMELNSNEEDVFGSYGAWGEENRVQQADVMTKSADIEKLRIKAKVTLSQLLDNVVILEESIKELAAIIHARKGLGIDAVRFL